MKALMARLQKKKAPKKASKDESVAKVEKKVKIKDPIVKKPKKNPIKYVVPKDEKLKKAKPPKNVLIVNPKRHQKDSTAKKFGKVITATFYEYAGITKVNGMYYLRQFVTSGWLRNVWNCIMIGLLTFAATLIYLLYRRYLDSPTRVTIASPMMINEIPFPGVTICHPQNVMEYKSKEFVKRNKLPLGATPERVIEILPLLAGFTERQWAYPRKEDLETIDQVLSLNNLSVDDAIDELGTVCQDFLLTCFFAGKSFPCFQKHKFITFIESFSYLGACCSFNFNPSGQDGDEVFNVNSFGINGGLNVIGTGRPQASDGKSGAVYSEGFVTLVHHPNDFAVESAPTTYIPLNTETFIDAQPIYSSCSDQVLALPFAQRKCLVAADLKKQSYRQPECMLTCLRDKIHQKCFCHPFHLPRNDNETQIIRDCKAKDVYCFVENYFDFKTVQCDHCYPACTEITYKTNSFRTPIKYLNNSVNPFYYETNVTKEEFIVRVYFGSQTLKANKKIVVMSWISLLSNLGGAFSLCLGISVLSFVEVIFFVMFRFYLHFKKIFQVGPVMSRVNNIQTKY